MHIRSLKVQQREMVYCSSIVYPGQRVGISFFYFDRTFATFSVFGECANIFQQLIRTPQGQYLNHGRRDITSEPKENKLQIKFVACPTKKYHSAYSPYALNYLNLAINIGTTYTNFQILSFYPEQDVMSEKPSQATVPLN